MATLEKKIEVEARVREMLGGQRARRSRTGSGMTATAAYGCSGWSQRPCWIVDIDAPEEGDEIEAAEDDDLGP